MWLTGELTIRAKGGIFPGAGYTLGNLPATNAIKFPKWEFMSASGTEHAMQLSFVPPSGDHTVPPPAWQVRVLGLDDTKEPTMTYETHPLTISCMGLEVHVDVLALVPLVVPAIVPPVVSHIVPPIIPPIVRAANVSAVIASIVTERVAAVITTFISTVITAIIHLPIWPATIFPSTVLRIESRRLADHMT